MAQDKSGKPSVATYGDHEIITPPNKLRRVVSIVEDPVDDPVTRAEVALARLAGEFSDWMVHECERLDAARHALRAKGFAKDTRDALFHAAHDIKGQAATFGFPTLTAPAESLCRLIEHTPDLTRIPMSLVDQHVDTVRAIIRESNRRDIKDIANALTRKLRNVTDEFLRHENRDRPEVLAEIALAPPLAPERS